VLPDWFKPFRFTASMREANAVPVLGKTGDPARDDISVVRRVQKDEAAPWLDEAVVFSVMFTVAQSHGRGSAAQGSRSNAPIASMIHFGVMWVCDEPTHFWWLPKVMTLPFS
jgi:hypothetical protein